MPFNLSNLNHNAPTKNMYSITYLFSENRPLWKYINFKIYKGNVEYNNDNVFLVIELHKHREIIMKKFTQKVQLREIC